MYGGAGVTKVFEPYYDNVIYRNNKARIEGDDVSSYPARLYLSPESTLLRNNPYEHLLN